MAIVNSCVLVRDHLMISYLDGVTVIVMRGVIDIDPPIFRAKFGRKSAAGKNECVLIV